MGERFLQPLSEMHVMEFAGELDPPPAWVTSRSGGHGFAELAEALLSAR
jgi:hypothetical protein